MNIPGTEQSVQPFLIGAAVGFVVLVLLAQVLRLGKAGHTTQDTLQ